MFKFWFVERFRISFHFVYLAMGWMVVVAAKPVIAHVPMSGLFWLGGGRFLLYSGSHFLRLEAHSLCSCDLAHFCAGWQRMPLFRGVASATSAPRLVCLHFTSHCMPFILRLSQ